MRPPVTPPTQTRPSFGQTKPNVGDAASDIETPKTAPPATRTKSLGHARRESIQRRRAERAQVKTANVPEETDAELAEQDQDDDEDGALSGAEGGSPGTMKPVFLKGLFSVSTTSSKPFKVIEADIIRVLKQLGVEYRSNGKGGFRCRHKPSIDLNKPQDEPPAPQSMSHRRKISFSLGLSSKDREHDESQTTPRIPQTPNSTRSNRRDESDDERDESETEEAAASRRKWSGTPRAAGETSTHVQSDVGSNMTMRFEIFVVKVPLLSLHGIQFKKLDGNTWQYKNMAQTILNELKL